MVSSGVVRGPIIGNILYTIFNDSLLWQLKLPVLGFADIKLLVNVSERSQADVQDELNITVTRSLKHQIVL